MGSPQKRAFESFAKRVEEEMGQNIKQLVLYGSVARDEENQESDVDVFAVVEDEKDEIYEIAAETGRKYGVHIAVVVRTEEEFERTRGSFFTEEVMETGTVYV